MESEAEDIKEGKREESSMGKATGCKRRICTEEHKVQSYS